MAQVTQRSFSGGEVAPAMYARVDQIKYATGLRTCRNFTVLRYGGVANRAGSTYIGPVNTHSKSTRLIPFIFNDDQTYVLEFGDLYMRVIKNGAHITEAAKTITGATQANPAVVTITAHGYANGEEVYINGVAGMTELSNRNFKVDNVTANTFELKTMDLVALDSSAYNVYTSGGTAAKIYEIATPYTEAQLFNFDYVESADVVTIVHPSHKPAELIRTGDASWTLSDITFSPTIPRPVQLSVVAGASGSNNYSYKVTAVDSDTGEESLASLSINTFTVTGITQANPTVVTTSAAHAYNDGDEVYIQNVLGMIEINDTEYIVSNVTATTFELIDTDSSSYTAYSSAGTSNLTHVELPSAAAATSTAPHTIDVNRVANAKEYNLYKAHSGIYGLISITTSSTLLDIGLTPDTSITPPGFRNPFRNVDDYPSTVTYIQQRLALANTNNNPEKIYMSRTGNFKNFTTSAQTQDDDAITFNMSGREVNAVKSMVDVGRLIILTSGGEWSAAGDEAGVIRPASINTKQYSYNGSSAIKPIVIDGAVIYLQARGSIIRDLGYDFQVDGYKGNELTIFSSHLVDGFTVIDWAYQQIPQSVLWVVRDDGVLLGMTYVKEQEVLAWHHHDFDGGVVESVTVVPEGNEDSVYVIVRRTINGFSRRYIEKVSTRQIGDIKDMKFMDSNLSYDGRNTDTSHTMTLSGGTDWLYTETLTLTSSAAYFTASDVGNAIHLTGSGGTLIRATITAYTSATVVSVKPHMTVPVTMRTVAITSWIRAVDQVTGLWHLEGEEVSIFADEFVVASPNNSSYNAVTVANGTVTLDKPYGVIHVGLPYISDIETLDIDTPDGDTLTDKNKIINQVNMYVEASRGVWVGPKPPSDDAIDPLEDMVEAKLRSDEDYNSATALITDTIEINIKAEWNSNGRVFVRQIDPIPLTILSVSPMGKIGG